MKEITSWDNCGQDKIYSAFPPNPVYRSRELCICIFLQLQVSHIPSTVLQLHHVHQPPPGSCSPTVHTFLLDQIETVLFSKDPFFITMFYRKTTKKMKNIQSRHPLILLSSSRRDLHH